jgi:hypothetical protein
MIKRIVKAGSMMTTLALVAGAVGLGYTIHTVHSSASPDFRSAKVEARQARIAQAEALAQQQRFASWIKTNPDPAKALGPQQPKIRMLYDTAPCPGGANSCEHDVAPLPGDGKFYQITNYFEGASFEVFAGGTLISPGGTLSSASQGFIMTDSHTYPLPMSVGIPTLTRVVGSASGTGYFTTSQGYQGSIDLDTGEVSITK